MGIISRIKGLFSMIFKRKAEEDFDVESITSQEMEALVHKADIIYRGRPPWVSDKGYIKTINFAKSICSETARLATLAIGIQLDGSARAKWLQEQIDKVYFNLRHWVEYGCAYGTVVLKPNGESIEIFTPEKFIITDQSDGKITGIVFVDKEIEGKKTYTRFEYHRWLDGLYVISNKCYVSDNSNAVGRSVNIANTPWSDLEEEVGIENINKPLYAVFRTPSANNVDIDSTLGMPIFAEAIEELKDLDIAYSRNSKEIYDSKRTVLLDSDKLLPSGGKIRNTAEGFKVAREELELPDYVKNVYGSNNGDFYQEINPTLQTDARIAGINALLSQIGYKCGFSNGYFVFNEKTGMVTATQVESDDRRTIELIKDVRDKLESCLDDLLYALSVFADLYDLSQAGEYEVTYDFGDITYNREEDRARWYGYVTSGKIPFWYYLVKFEGFTEEDAKAIEAEAQPKEPTLFGEEE